MQKAVRCLALLCRQVNRQDSLSGEDSANWHPHRPITEWYGLEGTSRTPCHGQRHFHYCRSPGPSLPPAQGVVAAPIIQQFQSSLMLMSLVRRDPFGIIYIETVFLHAKWKNAQTSVNGIWITTLPHVAQLYSCYLLNRGKMVMQSITEQLPERCCKPVALCCRDSGCPWLGQNLPTGHLQAEHPSRPWSQLNLHSETPRYQENFYWWN